MNFYTRVSPYERSHTRDWKNVKERYLFDIKREYRSDQLHRSNIELNVLFITLYIPTTSLLSFK